MKHINEEFKKLAKDLGHLRKFTEFATVQEVAQSNDVTLKTVYNFENGKTHNLNLLLYYYYNITDLLSDLAIMEDIDKQFEKVMDIETNDSYSSHQLTLFRRQYN